MRLEGLVPADHLLRQVVRAIDFGFVPNRVAHPSCADNAHSALDPGVLLLIGNLFGVRPERQLRREIAVNVAYANRSATDYNE